MWSLRLLIFSLYVVLSYLSFSIYLNVFPLFFFLSRLDGSLFYFSNEYILASLISLISAFILKSTSLVDMHFNVLFLTLCIMLNLFSFILIQLFKPECSSEHCLSLTTGSDVVFL